MKLLFNMYLSSKIFASCCVVRFAASRDCILYVEISAYFCIHLLFLHNLLSFSK